MFRRRIVWHASARLNTVKHAFQDEKVRKSMHIFFLHSFSKKKTYTVYVCICGNAWGRKIHSGVQPITCAQSLPKYAADSFFGEGPRFQKRTCNTSWNKNYQTIECYRKIATPLRKYDILSVQNMCWSWHEVPHSSMKYSMQKELLCVRNA